MFHALAATAGVALVAAMGAPLAGAPLPDAPSASSPALAQLDQQRRHQMARELYERDRREREEARREQRERRQQQRREWAEQRDGETLEARCRRQAARVRETLNAAGGAGEYPGPGAAERRLDEMRRRGCDPLRVRRLREELRSLREAQREAD